MKAVRLRKEGLADELLYENVPVPEITAGTILVEVYATSVNQIDWKKGSGMLGKGAVKEYPWTPGMDFCGKVEEVGSGVKDFRKGDLVFGCSDGGSYAEYVVADPSKTVIKPDNLDSIKAASAAYVSQTAWQAIFTHGRLVKGERVLIHGAAGAVGAYAVQFAHLRGAYVFATASGTDADFVRGMGADKVIDYKKQDFTRVATGLDLVIDLVGGESHKKSYGLLKTGGRLVTLVEAPDETLASKYRVEGIRMVVLPSAPDLKEIASLLESGKVKVDIAAVFPLKDMSAAWEYLLDKNNPDKKHGKIAIKVK